MRTTSITTALALTLVALAANPPLRADADDYALGDDSKPHKGIPEGTIFSFELIGKKIFRGTHRTITVYVPAQYTGNTSSPVYVGLDGLNFNVPVVFDNLIAHNEMPITLAVGVGPGVLSAAQGSDNPRFNRSYEFDGMNDALARFIEEEVFVEVERRGMPNGTPIKISKDPNERCVGGGSTGGIGAFTMAWQRPDLFRRVFSAIGTFVGMRGGDSYPVIVRKTEPKPLRIYLQDGQSDEWMGGPELGDWWMGNQTLERALSFSGYDHKFVWGTGGHNPRHASAIFPDAMRFIWKGWPKSVSVDAGKSQNLVLNAVIDQDATWEPVEAAGTHNDLVAVNPMGEVFIRDDTKKAIRKVDLNGNVVDAFDVPKNRAFAFSAQGRAVTVGGINASFLATAHDGRIYATETGTGKAWLIKADRSRTLLDDGLLRPTGIALSPDGLWLAIVERDTKWGYSYRVNADGTVDSKQRFYWAHVPDRMQGSGAGGVTMDREGYAYVATYLGVQVFDRNGRSRAILTPPMGASSSVLFGGGDFHTLFVCSGGHLYKRRMKAQGAPSFMSPFKLPPWGSG